MSVYLGLETALSGVLAQQRALDVTAHNISNASTPGFTRQEAVLGTPSPYEDVGHGQIGAGVDITAYRRIRDDFIDVQLRAQTMRKGYADATQSGLQQVELALAEPSDNGVSSLLQKFWSSWQDVSNNPESLATRQALVQSAQSLAQGLNSLSSSIATVQTQTEQNVSMTVDQVNSITSQIATLNDSIVKAKTAGDQPNDLLDQRDLLLDQLSELGNVSWTDSVDGSGNKTGAVDVSIGSASVVAGATSTPLTLDTGTTPPTVSTVVAGVTTAVTFTSGKLAALGDLETTTLPDYLTRLDAVAKALADGVNAQHKLGYDAKTPSAAGGSFFTYTGGSESSTIAVSSALASDPMLIAAASAAGQVGDGANALAIADQRGSASIDQAYSQLVTQIGSDVQSATRVSDNATALTDSLQSRRQSVSGVSLDEEMTNLLRFQRGFQASARALTAMDDIIDQLVSRTGRVGL